MECSSKISWRKNFPKSVTIYKKKAESEKKDIAPPTCFALTSSGKQSTISQKKRISYTCTPSSRIQ